MRTASNTLQVNYSSDVRTNSFAVKLAWPARLPIRVVCKPAPRAPFWPFLRIFQFMYRRRGTRSCCPWAVHPSVTTVPARMCRSLSLGYRYGPTFRDNGLVGRQAYVWQVGIAATYSCRRAGTANHIYGPPFLSKDLACLSLFSGLSPGKLQTRYNGRLA